MTARFYAYPKENSTFQKEFLFATNEIVSYTYTKKFCGTGSFTLVIPIREKYVREIIEDCLINIDGDWLVVNDIMRDDKEITINGTDLNGWLDLRITAFGKTQVAGAEGYDVVSGTTGDCVNHYIKNNATAPEDSNRKLPRLVIGQTAQGKESDSYMARLKSLAEVVGNLCLNAGIGYEITADVENNRFVFNTLVGTDHSAEQSTKTKVIFTQNNGSLFSANYERGNSDLLNTIYATGADVTQTVYRDDLMKTGVLRREAALDVSVSTVSDIKDYALAQVTGNILTNSYEIDIRAIEDYNNKYKLGDYITVKDELTKTKWTAQIEEATKTFSASEKKISLVVGDAKTKLLNKIQNTANLSIVSEKSKSENAVEHATKLITGNVGGYVLIHFDDETKQPYEILIMDNEDYKSAKNIWRWNQEGFGHSNNGYEGPYDTAITMDGHIVANFITTGILQSLNESLKFDLDNGIITTVGDNGQLAIDAGAIALQDSDGNDIARIRTVNNDSSEIYSEISADHFQVYGSNGTIYASFGRNGSSNDTIASCDKIVAESITICLGGTRLGGESVNRTLTIAADADGTYRLAVGGKVLKPIHYTDANGNVFRYWGWDE